MAMPSPEVSAYAGRRSRVAPDSGFVRPRLHGTGRAGLIFCTRPFRMRWLYRLQARFGLTGPEGAAALAILLALTGGTVARHLQSASAPLPADFYAAADAAFATASQDSASTTSSTAPLAFASLPASGDLGPISGDAGDDLADSSAADIAEAAVEVAAAPRRSGKAPPVRTNINTASVEQLQRLPRIGPALAARIVEHRRVHGPFRHPDRIVDVRGIGDRTLDKLRPWIHL